MCACDGTCSAFFPLDDPNFLSWPMPYYFGVPSNAATAPDQLFGNALSCNREAQVHLETCKPAVNLL